MINNEFKLYACIEYTGGKDRTIEFKLREERTFKFISEWDFKYKESYGMEDPEIYFFKIIKEDLIKIAGDYFVNCYIKERFRCNPKWESLIDKSLTEKLEVNRFEKLSLEELKALSYCIRVFSEQFDPFEEDDERLGIVIFKIKEQIDFLIGSR